MKRSIRQGADDFRLFQFLKHKQIGNASNAGFHNFTRSLQAAFIQSGIPGRTRRIELRILITVIFTVEQVLNIPGHDCPPLRIDRQFAGNQCESGQNDQEGISGSIHFPPPTIKTDEKGESLEKSTDQSM
jgi:hypothetical protein